jgi:allophanate hydrolase subunit 1
MIENSVEKVNDSEVKIITTITKEVSYTIEQLEKQRDEISKSIASLEIFYNAERAKFQQQLDDLNAVLNKADELGVVKAEAINAEDLNK